MYLAETPHEKEASGEEEKENMDTSMDSVVESVEQLSVVKKVRTYYILSQKCHPVLSITIKMLSVMFLQYFCDFFGIKRYNLLSIICFACIAWFP